MSKQDTDKPRFHPKFRHVVILIFVTLLAAWVLFRFTVKSKLEDAYAQIRADGYPVTFDEWYTLPDGVDNAADVIQEASLYYAEVAEEKYDYLPRVGSARLPDPGDPMPAEMSEAIVEYLEENAKALELLHKASAMEHCRFLAGKEINLDDLMPCMTEVKRGVNRLSLEAFYYSEIGETDKAVKSVKTIIGLSLSLSNAPTLISHLIEMSCKGIAIESLERLLSSVELTDDQLREVYDSFSTLIGGDSFELALAGERCFSVGVYNMPTRKMVDYFSFSGSWYSKMGIAAYKLAGLTDADELVYIDIMSDFIVASKLPLPEARKAFKAAGSRFANLSFTHYLLAMYTSSIELIAEKEIDLQARLNAALAVIVVERYRIAEGYLPDKLSNLVPRYLDTVPIDPFDGNELRYKKLEPGYVVYSVGEDGVDNGGQYRISATAGDYPVTISR